MSNVRDLNKYRKKKENEQKKRQRDLERWRKLGFKSEKKKQNQSRSFDRGWRPLVGLFIAIFIIVYIINLFSS